jgi:two-component system, OmpR family, heavy metal sensor histidine kinase CusS
VRREALRREHSIRFRLTVWYALILVAALSLFGALLWISLRQRLLGEVDRDLSDRAARFQIYVTREAAEVAPENLKDEMEEFCQALPPADYLELHGSKGFEFHYPNIAPGAARTRAFEQHFEIGGELFQLRISASLESIHHTLDLLQWLLLSLVPVVVAIACAGGAWLSRRALKPVDEVTTAARTIGIDNLSLRLRTPRTGDELQRLTEVWNAMLERLEAAVKTLSQFAADASHELRTPLSVIRTSAELALRRARSPESYRESLREIAEEAERMTQLVDDLLFLARNDAHATEMPKEPLDLNALVLDVASELRGLADVRQIRIRIQTPGGSAQIAGNRPALRRLFLVLLDNALKYSPAGSDVVIAASTDGNQLAVTIEDFGIGISQTDLPNIFKRFYQTDRARADGGFGLGLSLAESIARAHHASIDVKSAEGAGSTFRVVFQAGVTEFDGTHPARTRDPQLSAPL